MCNLCDWLEKLNKEEKMKNATCRHCESGNIVPSSLRVLSMSPVLYTFKCLDCKEQTNIDEDNQNFHLYINVRKKFKEKNGYCPRCLSLNLQSPGKDDPPEDHTVLLSDPPYKPVKCSECNFKFHFCRETGQIYSSKNPKIWE